MVYSLSASSNLVLGKQSFLGDWSSVAIKGLKPNEWEQSRQKGLPSSAFAKGPQNKLAGIHDPSCWDSRGCVRKTVPPEVTCLWSLGTRWSPTPVVVILNHGHYSSALWLAPLWSFWFQRKQKSQSGGQFRPLQNLQASRRQSIRTAVTKYRRRGSLSTHAYLGSGGWEVCDQGASSLSLWREPSS